MTASAAVFAILVALLLGAMIPGPSFVLVARNAIGLSRRDGLATALGMGAGALFFGGLALAGLYTLLQAVEWLYIGLKMAGGARKSFWTGITTQMSNPKTAIWYGSIFAALLPQHPPVWCYFVLPPLVFLVEFGWYTIVALCFSSRVPREMYLRAKAWVDRVAAVAIAALGLRLILTAPKAGL